MINTDKINYLIINEILSIVSGFDPSKATKDDLIVLNFIKSLFDTYADKLKNGNERINNKIGFEESLHPRDELGRFTFKECNKGRLFRNWELPPQTRQLPEGIKRLSKREYQVAHLVSIGFENEEIAEELVISYDTAKAHVSRILSKLNARNRTEAGAIILRHSIINHEIFDFLKETYGGRK